MFRIGLLVVYGYSSSIKKQDTSTNQGALDNEACNEYKSKLKALIDQLEPQPLWTAYWVPEENMRNHEDENSKGNIFHEINPVTAFIAHIDET